MWRRMGQRACFLLLLLICGCKGMFGRQGLPPDPLFANRKPIESQAKTGPPEAMPFTAPVPPVNPYFVDHQPVPAPLLRTGAPTTRSAQ